MTSMDHAQAHRLLNSNAIHASAARVGQIPHMIAPYIAVGDEPAWLGSVDLFTQLAPAGLEALKTLFAVLPREFLRDWYVANIRATLPDANPSSLGFNTRSETTDMYGWPTKYVPAPTDDMTWASIIDVFNTSNGSHTASPWDWEREKYAMAFRDQAAREIARLRDSIENYSPPKVSVREAALLGQFMALPKLGDTGLNINLQNDVKMLLSMGEYDLVEAIINAYNQGHGTLGPVLTEPIKNDMVLPDGNVLLAT